MNTHYTMYIHEILRSVSIIKYSFFPKNLAILKNNAIIENFWKRPDFYSFVPCWETIYNLVN